MVYVGCNCVKKGFTLLDGRRGKIALKKIHFFIIKMLLVDSRSHVCNRQDLSSKNELIYPDATNAYRMH